jgi:hypothetical protein
VRGVYDAFARGDVDAVFAAMTPEIEWDESEGMPYGGVYGCGFSQIWMTPWLLVAGLAGHGLKDLWQHRTHFVANTRWWPPFCMVVAAIIAVEIAAGMLFS